MVRTFSLALLAAAAFATPAMASAETLTLRADTWCPYNCAPDSPQPGYMIEVAKSVFGKAGITVDYQLMPWERTVAEVQAGHVDGAVGASPDDVKGGIVPRLPLGMSRNVLVLRPDSTFNYDGVKSLAAIHIGVAAGYSYDNGGDIDSYIKASTDSHSAMVEAVSGDNVQMLNMKKLMASHIDAVLDDQNVLALVISQITPPQNFKVVPATKPTAEYIVFSPKNPNAPKYAKLLDDGLDAMRKSGELATILAKYHVSDWQVMLASQQ